MKTSISFFGQLTDITNTNVLELEAVADTDTLRKKLYEMFPALSSATFIIALDNHIVRENISLTGNHQIALMPPFSGG